MNFIKKYKVHKYLEGGVLIYPDDSYLALNKAIIDAVFIIIDVICKYNISLRDVLENIRDSEIKKGIMHIFNDLDINCNSIIITGDDSHYYPVQLSYEVTHRCNLKCRHCYIDKKSVNPKKEMNPQDFEIFLSKLDKYNLPLNIQITGGEPLLRKDIWDILEIASFYAKDKWSFNTNGLLINREIAETIDSYGPSMVAISLDGDKESHEFLRGRGTFEKTLNAIKIFNKYTNVDIEIDTMITRKYPDTIERVKRVLQKEKIKYKKINYGFFMPVWGAKDANLVKELLLLPSEFYGREYSKNKSIQFDYWEYKPSKEWNNHCSAGFYTYILDPYGNIFPCVVDRIKIFNMGNILINDENYIFKNQARKYFSRKPLPDSACYMCPYNKLCKSCLVYQSAFCNRIGEFYG